MKKKKLKNSTEKAFKVVNLLKENAEILHERGNDTLFISELEVSVQKLEELEKELAALKETMNDKKDFFKHEKEIMLELVKNAEKVLKKEVSKKQKPEQKKQLKTTNEKQKVGKQVEKMEKPVKTQKPEKQTKPETTDGNQNVEIAEKADEPK